MEVILKPIAAALAAGHASAEPTPGRWQVLPNQHGARERALLYSPGRNQPPVLEFAAPTPGTYDVFVGIKTGANKDPFGDVLRGVYVKPSTAEFWQFLLSEIDEECCLEVYAGRWALGPATVQVGSFDMETYLDYVRLAPASGDSPRQAALREPARQEVAGICDIPDDAYIAMPDGREAAAVVASHAEAGFTTLYWRAAAVKCEYHTKVGEVRNTAPPRPAGSPPMRKTIETLLQQYDVLAQAVAEARRQRLRIVGWMRINNEMAKKSPQFHATAFHRAHPEYLQRYKTGEPSPRLSFAVPEVRQWKTAMALEIADHGVDGILIDCLRHPPMVQYDDLAVQAFIARHGEDPRQQPGDGSEAWLRFRAEYFTQFLRDVRAALRARHGDRVALAVRCFGWLATCLRYGLDVEAWLREGLVDELVVALYCNEVGHYYPELDYAPFKALAGPRVRVIGQVWRFGSMPTAEALAKRFRAQGLDGVAFYESNLLLHHATMRERVWRCRAPERWL